MIGNALGVSLQVACMYMDLDAVEKMIERGADVNTTFSSDLWSNA
jgi:ankyrin repeat protein